MMNQVDATAPRKQRGIFLVIAGLGIVVIGAVASTFGSVAIPLDTLVQIIAAKFPGAHIVATWQPSWETILFDIRLPRIVCLRLSAARSQHRAQRIKACSAIRSPTRT